MELGKKIRQLRQKAGWTQEQLAEKMGVAAQSVSKWENAAAMPDITALPLLAENFGVTIDDLFDLTNEQRLNRIENRLDIEEDLPQDVFTECEEFLKSYLAEGKDKLRATELTAYLYWRRMDTYSRKAAKYAEDAVRMAPDKKGYQWVLHKTSGHAVWDWNVANHTNAIEFYYGLVKENPESVKARYYLLDNLIADHRADEAEKVLENLAGLKDANPVLCEVYKAHIALARFNESEADRIMENLAASHASDSDCLFEAAQYYAMKCDYEKAIEFYERSFAADKRRPRFMDALMGIADIYQIMGDFRKAASTYDRIVELLEKEWGLTEEAELAQAKRKRAELASKI